ncbi:MAG: hypothetical protein JSW58_00070 [Candidatus Latescibacterota bacterium]|nr:MAG: hypothetical protein JSW58_00070 [Candidatus Latescibacterota bacterium]
MIRQTVHAIVAVLLWIVFVYYWSIVIRRPMNPDTKMALIALTSLTVLSAIYLAIWIYHNVRVHRKYRDRRRLRREATPPDRDYLGRRLVMADPEGLRRANYIEVKVVDSRINGKRLEQKIFRWL